MRKKSFGNLLLTALIISALNCGTSIAETNQIINTFGEDTPSNNTNPFLQTYQSSSSIGESLIEPDYSQEIILLQNMLKKSPNDSALALKLAQAYERNYNQSDAIQQYKQVISMSKNNPEMLATLENIFKSKLTNKPNSPILNATLGSIYKLEGKYEDALSSYQKALNLAPSNKTIRLEVADLYTLTNAYDKALPFYNTVLLSTPLNNSVRLKKAECLASLNRMPEAQAEYKMLIKNDPKNENIKIALYQTLKTASPQKEIVDSIYPEYKDTPLAVDGYIKVAQLLKNNKQIDDSIEYYKSALLINPNSADSYIELSELYNTKGDKQSAKDSIAAAQKILPQDDPVIRKKYNKMIALTADDPLNEALELIKNGLYEDAISVYEAISPRTIDITLGIASCYQYLNNTQEALKYLNQALSMDENNPDTLYYFAFLYVNKEDYSKAKPYIQKALKIAPDNQKIKKLNKFIVDQEVNTLQEKAFYAFDTQNYKDALNLLNKVIALAPSTGDAYYYRGLVYVAQNKNILAINDFKTTLKLNPNYALAYYSLGNAYDATESFQSALAAYKKFTALNKEQNEYSTYATQRINSILKHKK
ncbi:MAG: tetratricopeptide repeat protein [Candidatus Gastranaerophilales bacterium]|nr:tetratricopeptide repeat protein [Candidatus Gastranaerophilales bacterium]